MMGGLWPCKYTRPHKICQAQRFRTSESMCLWRLRYLLSRSLCELRPHAARRQLQQVLGQDAGSAGCQQACPELHLLSAVTSLQSL